MGDYLINSLADDIALIADCSLEELQEVLSEGNKASKTVRLHMSFKKHLAKTNKIGSDTEIIKSTV